MSDDIFQDAFQAAVEDDKEIFHVEEKQYCVDCFRNGGQRVLLRETREDRTFNCIFCGKLKKDFLFRIDIKNL